MLHFISKKELFQFKAMLDSNFLYKQVKVNFNSFKLEIKFCLYHLILHEIQHHY